MGNLKQATCITIDVVDSRINHKSGELKKIAAVLNNRYKASLLIPFVIRSGDELFGIVKNIKDGYRIYKNIYTLTKEHQIPVYIGVGVGEIHEENYSNPDLVQGEAIWHAADALKSLKGREKHLRTIQQQSDTSFQFMFKVSDDVSLNMAVNYYVFFLMEKMSKRTEKQHYTIELIENNPAKKYKDFAKELDYDEKHVQSNISKLLRRAEYDVVKEAEVHLMYLLQSITPSSKASDLHE